MAKTVLITGATNGIGKAAALALAQRGYQLIIHGRNYAKTEAAKKEIIALSGNNEVVAVTADLYRTADVCKMCEDICRQYSSLDILINNAGGLMGKDRESTEDGVEKTFAVNVLAPFLITGLLMDLLLKSNDARIINVSSNSHQLNAKPNFDDIELKNHYNPLRAYGNSKLFQIWNTQHLANLLTQKGINNVRAYTLHPGAVATGFGVGSDLGSLMNLVSKLARPFFRSPEAGADTILHLATEQRLVGKSGDYFVNREPAKKSMKYFTPQHEQLIWDYCVEKIRKSAPAIAIWKSGSASNS